MKLLAATTQGVTTNTTVGSATAVYVSTKAATVISVIANDGTASGTDGTLVGSVDLPDGWTGVIHKDSDQFLRSNVNTPEYTKIADGISA